MESARAALALSQIRGSLTPQRNCRHAIDIFTESLALVQALFGFDRRAMTEQVVYIVNDSDFPVEGYREAFRHVLGAIPSFIVPLTTHRFSEFRANGQWPLPGSAHVGLVLFLDPTVAGGSTVSKVYELARTGYPRCEFGVITVLTSYEAFKKLSALPGPLFFTECDRTIRVRDPANPAHEHVFLDPGWPGSGDTVFKWIKRAPYYFDANRVLDPRFSTLEIGELRAQLNGLLEEMQKDQVKRVFIRTVDILSTYYGGMFRELCRLSPVVLPRNEQDEVEEFLCESRFMFEEIGSTFLPHFLEDLRVSCSGHTCYLKLMTKVPPKEPIGNSVVLPRGLLRHSRLEPLTKTRIDSLVAIQELTPEIEIDAREEAVGLSRAKMDVRLVSGHPELYVIATHDCLEWLSARGFVRTGKVQRKDVFVPTLTLLYAYGTFYRFLFGPTYGSFFEKSFTHRWLTYGRESLPRRLGLDFDDCITKYKTMSLGQEALSLYRKLDLQGRWEN